MKKVDPNSDAELSIDAKISGRVFVASTTRHTSRG
jgi:hypothetical protein